MNSYRHTLDRFLALDTAGATIHCALNVSGAIRHRSASRSESRVRNIAALTQELLRETALSAADIRGVIVALGPGSFTGLRVGLSFAKGFVAARRIPLVGVTRFAQVRHQLQVAGKETPDLMFVTMKGNNYYRYYRRDEAEAQVDVVTIANPDDLFADRQSGSDSSDHCYFIDCEVPVIGGAPFDTERTQTIKATIEALFGAAAEQYEGGRMTPWTELEPLYIQRSGAELRAPAGENRKTPATRAGAKNQNANSENV